MPFILSNHVQFQIANALNENEIRNIANLICWVLSDEYYVWENNQPALKPNETNK